MKTSAKLSVGAALALALAGLYLAVTWTNSGEEPPATPALVIPGSPAAVYDAILPEIRDRIAQETKIVRVDAANSIEMRFTAYLEGNTVRLVGITLTATEPAATSVSVASRRFSFLPGRRRDAEDAVLERSLIDLVRRRTSSAPPPPASAP